MIGKLTQRKLQALVERQLRFVQGLRGDERWEEIPERPWYRFGSKAPNPAQLEQADLAGLDLRGLEMPCANLRLVVCVDQDLTSARLDGGLLRGGTFVGSSFRSASLKRVDLTEARLERCDFRDADLSGAELENADLTDARIDWSAAGRGRYRVMLEDGLATGGYGEMEQDHAWVVVDQKRRCKIARFEGHSYRCFFSSDPVEYSGVVGVRISPDARWIEATQDGGRIERHPLPQG